MMDNIDSIQSKYFTGTSSDEENKQLKHWIESSVENKKRLFAEKDIWDTYGFHSNSDHYEPAVELGLLKKNLSSVKKYSRNSIVHLLRVAAVLAIVFGLGWSTRFISIHNTAQVSDVKMENVVVPKGQINQLFLSDGTRIWINSESQITFPSVFGGGKRIVKLNGEAYFEVARDKKHPFIVEAKGQTIEVLGTSFNVKAYESSTKIETTLATGRIKLQAGNQTTTLSPGEQSTYDKAELKMVVNKVNPINYSAWKDGRFEFQNEDLIEVFKIIERWYDVEIVADENNFKGMHFSGVIKRNKDAKHFLDLLNHSIPVQYKIAGDKIWIWTKNNNPNQ